MQILDRYILKQVFITTIFVGVVLSALVLITQSIRFLELVMNAGASGFVFWLLTLLALPRFLEIVIPIGLMAGVLFVYNRLLLDSELVAMKGLGFSPLNLARPALILATGFSIFLFIALAWLVPQTNAELQLKRQELRSVISNFLFRENVFNQAGEGLMVYVQRRDKDGALYGLIIHDARDKTKTPSTIIAARGVVVTSDQGQQVIVYNGARQDFDRDKNILRRLNFSQYTIDLPREKAPLSMRWREPEERTLNELLLTNFDDAIDKTKLADFKLEVHKRISTPFLVLSFSLIALYFLLLGANDRRGAGLKILSAVISMVCVQILYMAFYNFAKANMLFIVPMYLSALLPAFFCFYHIALRRNI